jgi:hypothetical protein
MARVIEPPFVARFKRVLEHIKYLAEFLAEMLFGL